MEWRVVQLERNSQNPHKDGVVVCHWEVTDIETIRTGDDAVDHHGRMYGSISFEPDSKKEDYIKWSELTEADVIGWVQNSKQINKDEIEASVAAQIADSKAPAILTGKPWSE